VVKVQVFPLPSAMRPNLPFPGSLVMMLPPFSRRLEDIEELEPSLPFLLHSHLVHLVVGGIAHDGVADPATYD